MLRILKLLCSGTIGCSRWRHKRKSSPDGSWIAAESWRIHRNKKKKKTGSKSEWTNWTGTDLEDVHRRVWMWVKGGKTEGVTLVPQTIHGMWLVWWPGGFSPRPLQPPSDQWWGGAATAPNSLSLADERPVVLEWHGLGRGQSLHTLNTFVTTHRMSFSTFTWEYSSQRYLWLSPSTILHNDVKFNNTKLVWKNYFLFFLCYK